MTPDGILSGIEAVEQDKSTVEDADIIVIAHGTNHFPNLLEGPMKQMMRKVKGYNSTAPIYWVNTFTSDDGGGNPAYTSEGAREKNAIIERLKTELGYTVIDVSSANISTYDGIHPDGSANGIKKYAKTVVEGISDDSPTAGGGGEESDATVCCPSGGGTIQQGDSNEETIWNFLVTPEASGGLGLSDTQAAGVLGNIEQESGFSPTAENGSSGAYGIAQWAFERRAGLEHYANTQGKDKSDITIQLEYMKLELTEGYEPTGVGSYRSTVYEPLKAARTMEQAVLVWLESYEKPCPNPVTGSCEDEMRRRLPFAQNWYDKFAGSGGGGSVSGGCGGSLSGGLPSGDSKELAQKLLPYIRDGKISCNGQAPDCPDIKKTADGASIRTGDSCWTDELDPKLLGMILKLVESDHTFVFSSVCSDHPSNPSSYHHKGKAVDFNYIDGVFMGPSADASWTGEKLDVGRKLAQDIASFMPKSTGFGQTNCHPAFDFLNGFSTFSDSCHHQHIQVE
jgi:hypothetical protein